MQYQCDEPIVIDLDDPAPRGARLLGVAMAVLVLVLVLAPYVIDTTDEDHIAAVPTHPARVASPAEYCQPAIELPGALSTVSQLAMPSFLRLCDWFGPQSVPAAPVSEPVNAPAARPGPER